MGQEDEDEWEVAEPVLGQVTSSAVAPTTTALESKGKETMSIKGTAEQDDDDDDDEVGPKLVEEGHAPTRKHDSKA